MPDRTRTLKDILWILALTGLLAGIFRMWFGLGATTNLSDAMPWGLWKILNMVAGVALSTSGFTVGFLVYVLKLKRFQPYMKPAILIAFLGYGCSMLALLFDIGLPQRFWHPIVMWNEHSFLFEVFWCVLLYFTVTTIELLPMVLEKLKAERAVRFLHSFAAGVVIVGISLSSLHHSSLGSLFLVTPLRLHELWYSSWLPFFFILSAMGAGILMLVLLRILYARWYDPEPIFGPQTGVDSAFTEGISDLPNGLKPEKGKDIPSLSALASIAAGILGVYLILKIVDLFRQGLFHTLSSGEWEGWLYLSELTLAAVLPILLVVLPRTRRSPVGLGVAAFSATVGLALNRMDVGIFGYFHDAVTVYFPSLIEWALGIGVAAAAGLVFLFAVENLAIFESTWQDRRIKLNLLSLDFNRWSRVGISVLTNGIQRVSLLMVFVIPLGWLLLYPPFAEGSGGDTEVQAAVGVNMTRDTLLIDGDRHGVRTFFAHLEHQSRLGGDTSCAVCHHISMPGDRSTPCSRCHTDMVRANMIFDHTAHTRFVAERDSIGGWVPANHTCVICHTEGQPKTAANAKKCYECHSDDMWLVGKPDSTLDLSHACNFRDAMHGVCLECHREQKELVQKENLDECSCCHQTLRARI